MQATQLGRKKILTKYYVWNMVEQTAITAIIISRILITAFNSIFSISTNMHMWGMTSLSPSSIQASESDINLKSVTVILCAKAVHAL